MRPLLLLCLLPSLALADVSRKPVIAVLPARTTDAGWARFALVMEARAVALLLQAQRHSVLDPKQVLAMANQEGLGVASLSDDVNADTALKLLGADRVVTVVLTPDGTGLTISGTVRDGKEATPFSVKGQGGPAALLSIGSEAIARAALEKDGATLAAGVSAQPESKSNAAILALNNLRSGEQLAGVGAREEAVGARRVLALDDHPRVRGAQRPIDRLHLGAELELRGHQQQAADGAEVSVFRTFGDPHREARLVVGDARHETELGEPALHNWPDVTGLLEDELSA